MKNNKLNAINLALACAIGVIGAGSLVNDSNPFNQQDLTNGYENGHTTLMGKLTIAESKNTETVEKHAEGKCGEGKCGESKADEKHAEANPKQMKNTLKENVVKVSAANPKQMKNMLKVNVAVN